MAKRDAVLQTIGMGDSVSCSTVNEVMDDVVEINEPTGGMQQPGSIPLKCRDTAYRSCAIFKWMVQAADCRHREQPLAILDRVPQGMYVLISLLG